MSEKRSRAYPFVLNNWTLEEREALKETECKYLIFGEEIAPTTGTPHLQGYVVFNNAKTMVAVHKLAGWKRVALMIPKGNAEQNKIYCSKDGVNVFEKGTPPSQGKRSDLDDVTQMVDDGASLREIAETHPTTFIKYSKGITALRNVLLKPRTTKPIVYWIYGPSGVGKTRTCVESHPTFYIKDGTQWWDGYEQQEAIIIDDFDPSTWNFRDFLRLLDFNPFQGQCKGSYVHINSPHIYITCEFPPEHYWKNNTLTQVTRRCDHIIDM